MFSSTAFFNSTRNYHNYHSVSRVIFLQASSINLPQVVDNTLNYAVTLPSGLFEGSRDIAVNSIIELANGVLNDAGHIIENVPKNLIVKGVGESLKSACGAIVNPVVSMGKAIGSVFGGLYEGIWGTAIKDNAQAVMGLYNPLAWPSNLKRITKNLLWDTHVKYLTGLKAAALHTRDAVTELLGNAIMVPGNLVVGGGSAVVETVRAQGKLVDGIGGSLKSITSGFEKIIKAIVPGI